MKKIITCLIALILILNLGLNCFAVDKDYNYYFGLGLSSFNQKDYQGAIDNYTLAINVIPKDTTLSDLVNFSNVFYNRSVSYYNLKQNDKSINDMSIYMFLNPSDPQGYAIRGSAYYYMDSKVSATNDCIASLKLDPKNQLALNIGNLLLDKNTSTTSIVTPIVSNSIDSKIDGEFTGWTGKTIFELANGQIWQQSSYAYTYHYAYNPKVLIYKDGLVYKMKVDGVDSTIQVKQIK